jgi:hypothetical protein
MVESKKCFSCHPRPSDRKLEREAGNYKKRIDYQRNKKRRIDYKKNKKRRIDYKKKRRDSLNRRRMIQNDNNRESNYERTHSWQQT